MENDCKNEKDWKQGNDVENINLRIHEKKHTKYEPNEENYNSFHDIIRDVECTVESMLTIVSCLKASDFEDGESEETLYSKQTENSDSKKIEHKAKNTKLQSKQARQKKATPKQVECEICKKSLAKRTNLLRHYQRSHQGIPFPPPKEKTTRKPRSYQCQVCFAKFVHRSSYKKHMGKHSDKFYNCDNCDFKSKYWSSIHQHKKTACFQFKRYDKMEATKKRESRIPCDECGKLFKSEAGILAHKAQYDNNCQAFVYTCKVCDKKFYQKCLFKEHTEGAHAVVENFTCPICSHKFNQSTKLANHIRYSHRKRWTCDRIGCSAEPFSSHSEFYQHRSKCKLPIPCRICEQVFHDMAAYSTHTHPIECDKCEKTYVKKSLMDKHVRFHDPLNPFKCEQCVFGFLSNGDLTLHLKTTHRKDNKTLDNFKVRKLDGGSDIYCFICKICQFGFEDPSKGELMAHVLQNHKDKLGKFICPTCEKCLRSEITLFNHRTKVHGVVVTEFQCDICSTYFLTKHGVHIHKTKLHYEIPLLDLSNTGETPAKPTKKLSKHHCSICGKKCVDELGIRRHMMSHSMDYPYKCKICTMSWIHLTYLVRHNQLRHSNLDLDPVTPNHVCHHCGKRFKTLRNLENHLRSVYREKPYKCADCDKCFTAKQQLDIHRSAIHRLRVRASCDFCQKAFTTKKACRHHMKRCSITDSCKN